MAHIKLKDGRQIKIEPKRAKNIQAAFENQTISSDTKIVVDEHTFTKAMIAYVSTSDEDDASARKYDENDKRYKEMVAKQHEEIESLLALPPKERASHPATVKRMTVFFNAITNAHPNQQQHEEMTRATERYFQEHKFPYANPAVYKPTIMKTMPPKDINSFSGVVIQAMLDTWKIGANYVPKKRYAISKQIESHAADSQEA